MTFPLLRVTGRENFLPEGRGDQRAGLDRAVPLGEIDDAGNQPPSPVPPTLEDIQSWFLSRPSSS